MLAEHDLEYELTAQVENLRRYIHDALGWSYSSNFQRPLVLTPMLSDGMIFSRSGAFTFGGHVRGLAFGQQSFELDDVTAVIPPKPEVNKFKYDPDELTHWDLKAFGKEETCPSNGFQGVILSMEHHTSFLGKTIIRRDRGRLNPLKVNGLKRVGFASLEFERLFEVYSEDQVEARDLISSDFMARLIDFDEDYLGRNIQCVFLGNKFHVCLDIDDRFDFSDPFSAAEYKDASTRILHEIGAIFYLLEKVQALQAKIGRLGPDGMEEKRGAYYRSLLVNLQAAISAGKVKFEEPASRQVRSFANTETWQHLLLQPRV